MFCGYLPWFVLTSTYGASSSSGSFSDKASDSSVSTSYKLVLASFLDTGNATYFGLLRADFSAWSGDLVQLSLGILVRVVVIKEVVV